MVVKIRKRDIDEVALLLRFEPGIRHHTLVEMRGVGPKVLTHTQISHGVGNDVALHDHHGILGHVSKMRLTIMPTKCQDESGTLK